MNETHRRTLTKAVTYRLFAWIFTIILTYCLTGNLGSSAGFSTVLHAFLTLIYYIHERIWLKIKWGL